MTNPTEKFQNSIIDAVNKAAANDVHPAIVFTVLQGVAGDVLHSIKKTASAPQPPYNHQPEPTPSNVEPLQPSDATK